MDRRPKKEVKKEEKEKMNFKDLIRNKKVAVVGPAAYLSGSGYGEQIDAHDIVVRLNRGIELVKDHRPDIGAKTDILYSCLIEKPANAGKLNPRQLREEHNIKYLCAPPESTYQGISTSTTFHHLVDPRTVNEIRKYMPIRIIDHLFHTILAEKVMCRPNTGFLAIYDLLRHEPETLSVYGFSFYLDGFIPGCKEGVQEEQNKNEDQFAEQCFTSKRHIQKNMWTFAKQTLLGHERINLDPVFSKILKLESLDKSLFAEMRKDEDFYTHKA
jgi:hypothetical protein